MRIRKKLLKEIDKCLLRFTYHNRLLLIRPCNLGNHHKRSFRRCTCHRWVIRVFISQDPGLVEVNKSGFTQYCDVMSQL